MLGGCIVQQYWAEYTGPRPVVRGPDVLALVVPSGCADVGCSRAHVGVVVQRRAAETGAHLNRGSVAVNVPEPAGSVGCALVPHVAIYQPSYVRRAQRS